MRRTAEEIIEDLEVRIARLEEDFLLPEDTKTLEALFVQLDNSFENSKELQSLINRDRELRKNVFEYLKSEANSRKKLKKYIERRLFSK